MSELRDLTIDKGLHERLTHLEQEEDPVKAAALFQEAEEYAFDALLNGAELWTEGNRGNFRRRWRALRAKYRRSSQSD